VEISKTIRTELQEIAPLLCRFEMKEPFKVPENYFNELPSAILGEIRIKYPEQLMMQQAADSTLYSVPENYFESLTQNVLTRVRQQPAKVPAKRLTTGMSRRSWLAAASVCLLIALSSTFILNSNSSKITPAPPQPVISQPAMQTDGVLESVSDMDESFILEAQHINLSANNKSSAQLVHRNVDLQDVSDLDLETINVNMN
jgi:hypothetical protein